MKKILLSILLLGSFSAKALDGGVDAGVPKTASPPIKAEKPVLTHEWYTCRNNIIFACFFSDKGSVCDAKPVPDCKKSIKELKDGNLQIDILSAKFNHKRCFVKDMDWFNCPNK
ncbi:MAG: hypothetical protein KGO96_07170 [Elusimicrobia bacterium]|nr:hypothetical protein [Elusimicrobiota bacterium]